MDTYILKPKELQVIQYKHDTREFFDLLKNMCGEDCTITYESCSIDNYWSIKVFDCLQGKMRLVPLFDYIVKLGDNQFTVMSKDVLEAWCTKVEQSKEK